MLILYSCSNLTQVMASLLNRRAVCNIISKISFIRQQSASIISPIQSRQCVPNNASVKLCSTFSESKEPEYIRPNSNTLFVKNVHNHATKEQLADIFPNAIDIRIPMYSDTTKRIAFIDFRTPEEVDELVKAGTIPITDMKSLELYHYNPRQPSTIAKANSLYVQHLPPETKPLDLKALFPKASKVHVSYTATLLAEGFGFVEFDDHATAVEVMNEFKDKQLTLYDTPITLLPYGSHLSKKFLEKDISPPPLTVYEKFALDEVREILTSITGFDTDKIFKFQAAKLLRHPDYKLLTEQQLREHELAIIEEGKQRLQMPPYLQNIAEDPLVLDRTPEMKGFTEFKYMFIDISKKQGNQDATVVVRDTDGTLRLSTNEEKRRMHQMFFPREGRFMNTPRVFRKGIFEGLLERREYVNLLDRACVQYEPETSEFIQICHALYAHVHTNKAYDELRSTRFFGPMVYHLTVGKQVEMLLIDMMQRKLLLDAAQVVRLYHIVYEDCASAAASSSSSSNQQLVQNFIDHEASKEYNVELKTALENSLRVEDEVKISESEEAAV